jgi:hypothetical protein
MSKVLLEMSMSLDGYVTGPDVSAEEPMGRGGEQLHDLDVRGPVSRRVSSFSNRQVQPQSTTPTRWTWSQPRLDT